MPLGLRGPIFVRGSWKEASLRPLRGLIGLAASVVALAAPTAGAAPYAAKYQLVTIGPPSANAGLFQFCPGEEKTFSVSVTNTGSMAWDTALTHLSYHVAQGANVVVFDGVRTSLLSPVAPGGSVLVVAKVKAPASAGPYTIQFDMVKEGVTWFSGAGSPTLNEDITVSLASVGCTQAPGINTVTMPAIEGCLPGTKPGLFVVCWGRNFGSPRGAGKVLMKGLPGSGDVDLTVGSQNLKWDDKSFFVDVRGDLGGFRKGQKVRIQVVNSQGKASNEWTIGIDPVLDVVDVSSGNATTCAGRHLDTCTVFTNQPGEAWHRGEHANDCCFGNGDAGTDVWKIALINDWVTDHVDFINDHPGQSTLSGFSPGVANLTLSVAWRYDWSVVYTYEAYDFRLWAIGPRGVPYK